MMSQSALKSNHEAGEVARCNWCREEAAVDLEGRSYCGTCFLWIAVRQHPGKADIQAAAAPGYFARLNESSR